MPVTLPKAAANYIHATNTHDAQAFIRCFDENAIVLDAGRELRGLADIKTWSDHEIMEPLVTLEVRSVAERGGDVIITTQVEGNFDRTGLPDPLIIDHQITLADGRITRLQCRLVN